MRWPESFKAGTEIRDLDGELVATICKDVYKHTIMDVEQWVLPDGSHPLRHAVMHPAIIRFLDNA